MTALSFIGSVEKGVFIPDSPKDYKLAYCQHEGKRLVVSLERYRKNRTPPQNRYYFGVVLKVISLHTGHSPEELHDFFKHEFNSKFERLGKVEVWIPQSTADLNTQEFSDYIENIKRFAAEKLDGLYVPDADEMMAVI